jgi:3-oxoacyl-[acyl-carrier protein] reductase
MGKLDGKVALVTGSGRGIGREVALRLAQEGASIVAHYSGSKEGAEDVVAQITADGGSAVAYQADITRRDDIVRMFEQIDKNPGVLDIVVNNSGVMTADSFGGLTEETVQFIFGVNVFGPLYIVDEAIKRMRDGGRIINFSSSVAKYPLAGAGIYSAAKKAIESFTESWARALAPRNITVNAIVPGAVSPGMMDANPQYRPAMEAASPFKRIGRASEIASIVSFLASEEGSWVTAGTILANGAANT